MKKKTRILLLLSAAALLLLILNGCSSVTEEKNIAQKENVVKNGTGEAESFSKETKVGYYLDTVITLTAYTEQAELLEKGLELCGEYEKLLSRTIEGSDVWRINHADGRTTTVSDETVVITGSTVDGYTMMGTHTGLSNSKARSLVGEGNFA